MSVFQFHYGTIKRTLRIDRTQATDKFQFHYGTIKRRYKRPQLCVAVHFNSTMVRLKGQRASQFQQIWIIFQFHYGTIKSLCINSGLIFARLFQFHYGTIKSGNCFRLNRTLARFQFHYGTIKSPYPQPKPKSYHYFNSTMVRLKASH